MPQGSIERTIDLQAPVSRVWRALTDSREFGTWFHADIHTPFVVGETSRGQMTYPGYEHFKWEATVTAMEPERRFAFTWPHEHLEGEDAPGSARETLVEFILQEIPSGTRLTVRESGFDLLSPNKRLEALRSNEEGWRGQLENIARHVADHP